MTRIRARRRRGIVCAVARNWIGRGGHERWHTFAEAVSVRVATGNAEYQAVEVVGTRAGDTSAKPLIGASEEAGESMRTVRTRLARNAAVDAGLVLASKARDAVVGVVAARLDAQTTPDAQVALVGRVAAVLVVLATAATGDETARQILTAGRKTDFAHRARLVRVA